jgi:hypothetical protein
MRAQTFCASIIMEVATCFEVQPVELSITCMKPLRAHPRHMTRASKLASCIHGFIKSMYFFLNQLYFYVFIVIIIRSMQLIRPRFWRTYWWMSVPAKTTWLISRTKQRSVCTRALVLLSSTLSPSSRTPCSIPQRRMPFRDAAFNMYRSENTSHYQISED